MDREKLRTVFAKLGAADPDQEADYAASGDGRGHLLRYLLIRGIWKREITADGDTSWIKGQVEAAESRPQDPLAGAGLALKRLLEAGADPRDLTELVRCTQYEAAFGVLLLIDDIGYSWEDVGDMTELDDLMSLLVMRGPDWTGDSTQIAEAVHESLLSSDPTGREMRPPHYLAE